eukprot:3099803-Rhodomonas_salina.2
MKRPPRSTGRPSHSVNYPPPPHLSRLPHQRLLSSSARYRVVLFDQRGCGSSTPRGTAVDNDTWKLVSDCEALRTNRSVDVWYDRIPYLPTNPLRSVRY